MKNIDRFINIKLLLLIMSERKEAWMRILIGIISGIVLKVWSLLIIVFGVINWFYVLFTKKRFQELAEMSEIWNTQTYVYLRYMTFMTNERPFPFRNATESYSKFKK